MDAAIQFARDHGLASVITFVALYAHFWLTVRGFLHQLLAVGIEIVSLERAEARKLDVSPESIAAERAAAKAAFPELPDPTSALLSRLAVGPIGPPLGP